MSDDPTVPESGDLGEKSKGEPAPLSELAQRIGERGERARTGEFDERFEEQTLEGLETKSVWDAVDASRESEFGAVGEIVEEGTTTYIVSKRNFCERCQHFSTPPDVACDLEGTEIREFVDKDHVRVYSCPVVEERGFMDGSPTE